MKQESSGDGAMVADRRPSLSSLLKSDVVVSSSQENDSPKTSSNTNTDTIPRYASPKHSKTCSTPTSGDASPYLMSSPWSQSSPYAKSPWIFPSSIINATLNNNGLVGSIVREEGHVYSLAAGGDLLYTGSDSKNIRVWRNFEEYTGFKSSSGLVKAIVIYGDRLFTGHQDGKIRIWKTSLKNPSVIKRIGTLPTLKQFIKKSVRPKNYVEARRNRNVLFIKHYDAVSCLSLNEEQGLLYSGSWDKTLKVWRLSDYKCLESISAHTDAINSVANGFDSLVFTGSADGTIKVWRRELEGNRTKHCLVQILLQKENAITALAVNRESAVIYCGSSDGLVNFWEREKHLSHGGVLRGHKVAVLCLTTAGNLVFSGSADKSICVWKREMSGVHIGLSVLSGHGGPVKCLAVEEDKEFSKGDQRWIVYSGSLDRSVKVWRVSENVPEWREYNYKQYQSPRPSISSPTITNKGT